MTASSKTVSIDDRPAIADSRERFGDWEMDTVLGKQGTGVIVTLLERKSRFFLIQNVDSKFGQDVAEATINLLMLYKDPVHTITADKVVSLPIMKQSQRHEKQSFTSLIHTVHRNVVQMKMLMDHYANMHGKGRTQERWVMMLYL